MSRPGRKLPLACRLPNPPASFVGREKELRWLSGAIPRAPLTLLHGESGVGKSAVLLAAIQREFPERLETTIYVGYREHDPHEHPALPIVRALLLAEGTRDVDWRELLEAPEGLGALAIDLAEASGHWVVLDDLDRDAAELLSQLCRYARSSRWLATMRVAPTMQELAGQTLRVRPLAPEERAKLARLLDPGGPESQRAFAVEADPLREARLLADERRFDALAALLDRVLPDLLSSGFAIALWSIVEGLMEPALESARLRIALELGDRDALANVREPSHPTTADRLLWASLLVAKGRFAEARVLAASLRAAPDPAERFQAIMLEAQAEANLGRLEEALSILAGLEAPSAVLLARRDSFRAQIASLLLREDEAVAHVERARRHLAEVTWPERGTVGVRLSRALYNLGRLREAAAVLEAVSSGDVAGSVRFDLGRGLRFLDACIALDRGDFPRVRASVVALEPWVGPSSPLRANLENARGTLAALSGGLEELDRAIAALHAMDLSPQLVMERDLLELRACLSRRRRADRPAGHDDGSVFAGLARLHRLRVDLHTAAASPEQVSTQLAALGTHVEQRILGRIVRAEALLAARQSARANVETNEVVLEAADLGFGAYEAEALALRCDVLMDLGDDEARHVAAADLARRAASLGSRRLAGFATLHQTLRHDLDPSALEPLAAALDEAPESALRARALLDPRVAVGVLDRRVLEAFCRRHSFDPMRTFGDGEWQRGCGVDLARRSVWMPNGAQIDFSRHALLLRILEVLAAHDGEASKESLVVEVWGERSYHPLKHDNRLHAAIRKLRKRLDEDAASPRWVRTTEEGYALGSSVRLLPRLVRRPT